MTLGLKGVTKLNKRTLKWAKAVIGYPKEFSDWKSKILNSDKNACLNVVPVETSNFVINDTIYQIIPSLMF